ncbi:hypothetical protein F442_00131 [Phytophthora nicotianae P10297]|uniref:Uncharacterized protein n=1 Tax=Phytophthora nicotianae P10297 TaxID=1317064 RepID=W3AA07_PHYNI|nr:hypothetical protein F442_00131 [Phytophthora nicotianae P10297]
MEELAALPDIPQSVHNVDTENEEAASGISDCSLDSDWVPEADDGSSGGKIADSCEDELLRKYDGIVTDATRVQVLFTAHLEPLPKPPPNCEKIQTIYNQVRRYVPEEFINDPLYDPPNDEGEHKAKAIQKARAEKRKEATKKKKRARAAASESATGAAAELTDEAQGKQPTQQEKKRTREI